MLWRISVSQIGFYIFTILLFSLGNLSKNILEKLYDQKVHHMSQLILNIRLKNHLKFFRNIVSLRCQTGETAPHLFFPFFAEIPLFGMKRIESTNS